MSGVYFILEGKVYPTPTLHDVLASRLVSPFSTRTSLFSLDHLSFVWGGSRLAQRDVPPRTVVLLSIRRAPLIQPPCYLSVALITPCSASKHCSTFCVGWHFSSTDASRRRRGSGAGQRRAGCREETTAASTRLESLPCAAVHSCIFGVSRRSGQEACRDAGPSCRAEGTGGFFARTRAYYW